MVAAAMGQYQPINETAIHCTECKHEVDEFTAATGWRYWSSLLPYCQSALDASSRTTLFRVNGVYVDRFAKCLSSTTRCPRRWLARRSTP
jgi:hypothetical protein